jgi:hypothetical protein
MLLRRACGAPPGTRRRREVDFALQRNRIFAHGLRLHVAQESECRNGRV